MEEINEGLHEFIIQLIQSGSLTLTQIKRFVVDRNTVVDLRTVLLKNYKLYELLLEIKNGNATMDLC